MNASTLSTSPAFTASAALHAVVPAAGRGARFGSAVAKQYAVLLDVPLIVHTVRALLADPRIARVWLVLAPDDEDYARSGAARCVDSLGARVGVLRCGGATRALSVAQALQALSCHPEGPGPEEWVLVHDAARPCLPPGALARLVDTVLADGAGGLLALPVADTLKRADNEGRVEATQSRDRLWSAQTPQMFRREALARALAAAGPGVTDEAQAMEAAGVRPLLVRGDPANLKVTWPADLALATLFLEEARR